MVAFLKRSANEKKIKWQAEVLTGGGTDTAAIQRAGNGAIAGALSIPLRYVHQTVETCHPDDVEATVSLLVEAAKAMDSYDWSH